MISPLVNPAAGYSTFWRFDSSSSTSSTRTRNRSLIDHLVGALVVAQPEEARETQPAVGRALGELQLHHDLRPYPHSAARVLARDRRRERRGRRQQRGQRGE